MQASHALGSAHHEAQIWLEIAARLASAGLLIVANGDAPAAARHILDVLLDRLPPLPPDHRDFERRMETRIRIETERPQERGSALRPHHGGVDVYLRRPQGVHRPDGAPPQPRAPRATCATSRWPGWLMVTSTGLARGARMAVHRLAGEERTKQDKEYYRTAEHLQRSKPLPDGCSAAE
ncbi:hypothetical protein AB1Y20_005860 [Prymnesium parvum]|uniref:Uncharacterized protein n=1 Tax=Prymnesium parvum TaxID=97485 RepID=A0AB34J2E7_PRYPA